MDALDHREDLAPISFICSRGWDDLRRRIDPPDRRCYAFYVSIGCVVHHSNWSCSTSVMGQKRT